MDAKDVKELRPEQWLGLGAFVLAHAGVLWMFGPQPGAILALAVLWGTAAIVVFALRG